MDQIRGKLILAAVWVLTIAAGVAVGYYLHGHQTGNGNKIHIVHETETVQVQHDVAPSDYPTLLAWYNDPLTINGNMEGNTLMVTAGDGHKEAQKRFKLDAEPPKNYAMGGMAVSFSPQPVYGIWVDYYRRLLGSILVGGGVTVTSKSFEARIGAGYEW